MDGTSATESMESRSRGQEVGSNPLFAAYQVCHDLCCSMVLEILHGQAQKLSARTGGLWASHLEVVFHQETQASFLLCYCYDYPNIWIMLTGSTSSQEALPWRRRACAVETPA